MLQHNNDSGLKPEVKQFLDRLLAGVATEDEIAAEITGEIYSGLKQYCSIPAGYEHCKLATREIDIGALSHDDLEDLLEFPPGEIINPKWSHHQVLELVQMLRDGDRLVCEKGNPLFPSVGAFFYGPPGTGKTHLMAAFARELLDRYDAHLKRIENEIASMVKEIYESFINTPGAVANLEHNVTRYNLDSGGLVESSPAMAFQRGIQRLKDRLEHYPIKPTDFLYLDFDQLVEFCKSGTERPEVIAAITNARVVFIDDVHPKNDPERATIIQHIIERRYGAGRPATFLTSNLDIGELGGGDGKIADRLKSRCTEMLFTVDFAGCEDWRVGVKARKISLIRDAVAQRLSQKGIMQDNGEAPSAE